MVTCKTLEEVMEGNHLAIPFISKEGKMSYKKIDYTSLVEYSCQFGLGISHTPKRVIIYPISMDEIN